MEDGVFKGPLHLKCPLESLVVNWLTLARATTCLVITCDHMHYSCIDLCMCANLCRWIGQVGAARARMLSSAGEWVRYWWRNYRARYTCWYVPCMYIWSI